MLHIKIVLCLSSRAKVSGAADALRTKSISLMEVYNRLTGQRRHDLRLPEPAHRPHASLSRHRSSLGWQKKELQAPRADACILQPQSTPLASKSNTCCLGAVSFSAELTRPLGNDIAIGVSRPTPNRSEDKQERAKTCCKWTSCAFLAG